jgi:hypothetical protein
VVLTAFVGALLKWLVLGNLAEVLAYIWVMGLMILLGGTTQALMIWMLSREAECLPDISVPAHCQIRLEKKVLTHLGDSAADIDVSVLSVHVHGVGSSQVSNHDSVVLDC